MVICDYEVLWENRPYILKANTYYWSGFYGNASQRHSKALRYVDEVGDWFCDVVNCLIWSGKITQDDYKIKYSDYPCVSLYIKGEEVGKFCISSSRRNVYKKQDIRKIKTLLRQNLKDRFKIGRRISFLSEDEVKNLKPKEYSKEISYGVRVPLSILPTDKSGIYEAEYNGRDYLFFVKECNKKYCSGYLIPKDVDKIIKVFDGNICTENILKGLEDSEIKDFDKVMDFCIEYKLRTTARKLEY